MIRFLTAVVGALFIVSTANAQTADDQKRIRQLAVEFDQAWNAHDAVSLVRNMTPDAQFVTSGGWRLLGRVKIESYHRRLFKGSARSSTNETTELTVRFVKPDVVLLNRRWLIKGDRYTDARPRADRTGQMTLLAEKRMGRWLITAAQVTNTFVPGRARTRAGISTP